MPHKIDGSLKVARRNAGMPYVRVNRGQPLQCMMHLARELGVTKPGSEPASAMPATETA